MKKLLLIGSLLVALLPASAYAKVSASPAVEYALQQSLMVNDATGEFRGKGMVTRLEFTLAVINHFYPYEDTEGCVSSLSSQHTSTVTKLFSDVEISNWYGKQLCVAMRAGLVQGYPDGSFRPFASITTAEASKILSKTYGLAYDGNGAWYAASMRALSARGAIPRTSTPGTRLIREDAAQMFYALRDEPLPTLVEAPTQTPGISETVTPQMPAGVPSTLYVTPGNVYIDRTQYVSRPSVRSIGQLAEENYRQRMEREMQLVPSKVGY